MGTPNVVLVTVDCLRYDRCGFNGHNRDTTPTLDGLANESYVFDRAYSTGPYTTESVPGIVAGQHSYNGAHYGDHIAWKAIPPESQTLATYLRDHGYRTLATLTNPHLTEERNFDRGFDRFRNLRTGDSNTETTSKPSDRFQLASLMYDVRSRMRRYDTVLNPYALMHLVYRYYQYRTNWPTVHAGRVLDEHADEIERSPKPFFAWTHLMDLHSPINPRAVRRGGLASSDRTAQHLLADAARAGRVHEPAYETLYDSALRYVDECIGRLVSALREQGRWEDTILVVTSDHGEVLFDRNGIYGHPRHHLYDELLHVPLLVRTPDGDGERIDRPVSLAWIHELLAEILDIESGEFPARSGSESILRDSDDESATVISDSLDEGGHSVAVRNSKHKLLGHTRARRVETEPSEEYAYFDRDVVFRYVTDRSERIPLGPAAAPELENRGGEIATHPDDNPTIEGEFGPDVEQRLRDLGYRM